VDNEDGQRTLQVARTPDAAAAAAAAAHPRRTPDTRQEEHVSFGIEPSLQLLARTIKSHGPFDGALCFRFRV
jgi:hypothetical protein